jgi:formate-nitrite transporter family protein
VGAPEPEEIFERTREEGKRRLSRPPAELISTAVAAGLDIVAGIVVLALVTAALAKRFGDDPAHLAGAIGFGVGFVFLIVGRAELFTENFLVPIAAIDRNDRKSWQGLAQLWIVSPIFNLVGGTIMILIATTHGVLPEGAGTPIKDVAQKLHANHALALFLSAVFAGALITAMTWFVEGSSSMGIRVTVAWITGAILAMGAFDHVIVATLELIFGIRYGAEIPWIFVLGNFGVALVGNMIGGILLVTLNRFTQARSAGGARSA